MFVDDNAKETRGLWEKDMFGNPPMRIDLIKSFNPWTSPIAREIDFEKYGQKEFKPETYEEVNNDIDHAAIEKMDRGSE